MDDIVPPPGPAGAPGVVTPPVPPPVVDPPGANFVPPPPPAPVGKFFDGFTDPAVKEHIGKKNYAGVEDLAKAYVNLDRLHSGATDIIGIPGPDAKPEDVNAFEMKLGRPATAADYKFEYPKDFTPDPRMEEFGREFFFKTGIPQAKVPQALAAWEAFVAKTSADGEAAAVVENTKALEAFKTGYKGDFNADVSAGQNIAKAIGLDQVDIAKLEASVGAAPIATLFAKLGAALSKTPEFKSALGSIITNDPLSSPEAAAAEIARLGNDKNHQDALWNKQHPQHAAALALQDNLFRVKGSKRP